MAITRYQRPFNMLQQLNREMNELASKWFERGGFPEWPSSEMVFTPVDIHEADKEIVVKMDVPGAKPDDIKIDCNGDMITISGERKHEKTEQREQGFYSERQYGSFMRRLALPTPVKQDEVKARYKDGVLEVHLPKANGTKTKQIKVEKG